MMSVGLAWYSPKMRPGCARWAPATGSLSPAMSAARTPWRSIASSIRATSVPWVEDVEHAVVPEDVLALRIDPRGCGRDVLRPDVDDHTRGSPSTRWAMMLRCTSEVPA